MTLRITKSKVHHMYSTSPHELKIAFVAQIMEVYGFSIGYYGEFDTLEKMLKITNSNCENIWLTFVGGGAFLILYSFFVCSYWAPC